MFTCARPRPSQLFPKKGPTLQENSSNQLSKKWGGQSPGRRRSGSGWPRAVSCRNILRPGSGRPQRSSVTWHPSCQLSLPSDPARPEGLTPRLPRPGCTMGRFAPGCTSRESAAARRLCRERTGSRPILVPPVAQHRRGMVGAPRLPHEMRGGGLFSGRL